MMPQTDGIEYRSRYEKYEDEAKKISRSFSWEVDKLLPDNKIAQAMPLATAAEVEEEQQLDWETFMDLGEAQNTSEELKIVTKEMTKAWGELCEALPKESKKKKTKIEWPTISISSKDEDTEAHSKMMKVKSGYQTLCSVANSYSGLFKFIPSGNEYVSVIVGVVTTIVTATVNHKTIGDGFHIAIEKIGEELRYCAEMLITFKNCSKSDRERMQTLIVGVFIQVFSFLVPYSKWCRSRFKRVINSLDSNYYKTAVEGPLAGIIANTGAVARQGNIQMARTLNDVQGKVQMLVEDKVFKRQELQYMKDEMTSFADSIIMNTMKRLREELGREGNLFTKVLAEQELYRQDLKRIEVQRDSQSKQIRDLWTSAIESSPPTQSITATSAIDSLEMKKLRWTTVELASRHLEITSENGYPLDRFSTLEDVNMTTTPQIFERLQDLVTAEYSQTLWLCDPDCSEDISEVSMAASYLLLVSERLKIPTVAYRFRVNKFGISEYVSEDSRTERSVQMDRMTMMVYSLIRQLVWLLPDEIESTSEFAFDRFHQLDGRTTSLPDAFNLLEELLALMPPLLICVFDGFELVDNDFDSEGTSAYLDLFLDILKKTRQDRVLKLLIASAGPCITLVSEDNVAFDEQVHLLHREDSGSYFPEVLD